MFEYTSVFKHIHVTVFVSNVLFFMWVFALLPVSVVGN